ncbi:MAG TPA: hypothetical protein VMT44_07120 [Methanoregula sp.]|nr:hypothetical protein [Methanoregula sp.]
MEEISGDMHQAGNMHRDTGSCFGKFPSICALTPSTGRTRATLLEYTGAALGVLGWLGVRQIGSTGAEQVGFMVWIAGGILLIFWGYHTQARGIMVINAVNVVMAASAFAALMR